MTKSMFIFHTQFVFFIRILLTKFLPHVGHEPIVVDLPRE